MNKRWAVWQFVATILSVVLMLAAFALWAFMLTVAAGVVGQL